MKDSGYAAKENLSIIIYGATGDLTARKLVPALYELFDQGLLPPSFRIVGASRPPLGDDGWRSRLREEMAQMGNRLPRWDEFARSLHYFQLDLNDGDRFQQLAREVRDVDEDLGTHLLHYLAIPPSLYELAARQIARSGLNASNGGWARLVVEKPFGRDVATAVALNRSLRADYEERQLFRIDHYLAKETVQNVLAFRLANTIFEPVWGRNYIHHVEITAAETLGVEDRAAYYEKSGVLRDMFQNHLMQLLAMIAIEPPARWDSESVRDESLKLFRNLEPFPIGREVYDYITLGQYTAGEADGKPVPAYRDEPGVDPESLVPTYARMKVFLDNWRWQGVPFFLTSGKRMARKVTQAVVQFKEVPDSMFRKATGETFAANLLTLGIQPEEVISLEFQMKAPGAKLRLQPAALQFDYSKVDDGSGLEAYARVLLDCINGHHMLFWRQDAIEESWRFIEPVLERCESCRERRAHLHSYPAGTDGPERARRMDLHGKE